MRARVLLVPLLAVATAVGGGAVPAVPAVAQTAATASLSGQVTASADGRPVAGVCVEVIGETVETVPTGADGRYRATGLPAGEYRIGFNTCSEAPGGFVPEFFDDAPTFDTAETVVLGSGQQRTNVDGALDPGATLRGRITDDVTNNPIASICVMAFDASEQVSSVGVDETGADGRYVLENLRAGGYQVVFFDCQDPFLYRDEIFDDVKLQDAFDGRAPTTVTLRRGEVRDGVDAGLELGGAVRGTVTGSHHGLPLDLVCVAGRVVGEQAAGAVGLSGVSPGFGEGLPRGVYVLGGLRPGRYDLSVDDPACFDDGYQRLPAGRPGPQQVDRGRVTSGVDLVVTPRPSISAVCFEEDATTSRFRDVDPRSVHAGAIDCAADYEIALGRPDGSYLPAGAVQRDQMASFVARTLEAAGVDLPVNPRDAFTDDNGNVHELAINQLAALEIVTGRGGSRYAPTELVTRAQMARFLVNAYERAAGFPLLTARDAFTDDQGDIHEDRIDKAAAAGLAVGTAGGGYAPTAAVRRDQMATFVMRLLDRVGRDTASLSFDGTGSFGARSRSAPTGVLGTG